MATLIVFPDPGTGATTVDGHVGSNDSTSWATTIAEASGSQGAFPSATDGQVNNTQGNGNGPTFFTNFREIELFDTSSLGAKAVISQAVISVWGQTTTILGTEQPMTLVSSNPAANNNVVVGDYSTLGSTSFGQNTPPFDGTDTVYTDVTINATGQATINQTGITKFGWKGYYDINAISPSNGVLGETLGWAAADTAGTNKDPKLTITFSVNNGLISTFKKNLRPRIFGPGLAR